MKHPLIILLLKVLLPVCAIAQFTPEHAALNNLRKGKWEKARVQLAKAIRKDSLNPSAHYALAQYFFTSANPDFQIDSAYLYTMQSLSDYQVATIKQRDRLKKIPLDSAILIQYRERIDSAAFERAKAKNTEAGYINFIQRFPFAIHQSQAIELRDEVAFLNALKENTYTSFLTYLEKYPQSARAAEAKTRYEKLLFESKTKDKKLSSYETFLREYPNTFHRREVEKQIFEISTASGVPEDFEKFLKNYPESSKVKTAQNILYHLLKSDERSVPKRILNDSIQKLQEIEKYYLVPFMKDGHVGFMNERGEEIIKPSFSEVADDYLCGNITDEWLVLDSKVVARSGAIIYEGKMKEVDALGYGFIKINTGECIRMIHASGLNLVKGCFQDVRILGKNYLLLKKDNQWSLMTFTGRLLTDFVWDEIQRMGDIVMFKKSGKFKLVKSKDIAGIADQGSLTFSGDFDDVKPWPNEAIWVRVGKEQGVLNKNLKEWIRPAPQEITSTFFGAISQTSVGYKLYDQSSAPSQNFIYAKASQPWVGVQYNGYWQLVDPVTKQFASSSFDTIKFNGPFAIGERNDSIRIYLSKNNFIELQNSQAHFLPGKDSLFFLVVEEVERKVVYDAKGQLLFSTTFENIQYNNEGYFTVSRNNKRGLINLQGRLIVQPEFDALGTINRGLIQVLKDKKFGLLDINNRREIKSEYDKNVVSYNKTVNAAFRNGFWGLIGWDNKPISAFEFEEILFWNDSSALVRKNFNWIIYNFIERKVIVDKIKSFKKVLDTDQEKILIIQEENNFGVISNKRGTIIPTTFTDIVNLGSSQVPLYFTEKHVEEASIFVVIYYDQNGTQLRKQVFEGDDYEKIYCSGN